MIKKRENKNKSLRSRAAGEENEAQTAKQQSVQRLSFMNEDEEEETPIITKRSVRYDAHQEVQFKKTDKKDKQKQGGLISASTRKSTSQNAPTSYFARSIGEYTPEKLQSLKQQQLQEDEEGTAPQFTLTTSIPAISDETDGLTTASENATEIPDEHTISRLKEKRKKLQNSMAQEDQEEEYIPLSGGKTKEVKRLVREEDEVNAASDDDESFEEYKGDRVRFGKSAEKTIHDLKKELEAQDEEMTPAEAAEAAVAAASSTASGAKAMTDEEDEELNRWELSQLKKAVPSMKTIQKTQETEEEDEHSRMLGKQQEQAKKKYKNMLDKYLSKDEEQRVEVTFEELEKKMNGTLATLKSDHLIQSNVLDRVERDLLVTQDNVQSLEEEFNHLNSNYAFFQKMREYCDNLIDCLDDKVSLIDEAEEKMLEIKEKYYTKRYQLWLTSMSNNNSSGSTALPSASSKAASFDGYSSDEEETESEEVIKERQIFEKQVQDLLDDVNTIFEDVNEEYCSIPLIKDQFEHWKREKPSAYMSMHCGLCAQKVFAPLAKMELLYKWVNPLLRPHFDVFDWWKQLMHYGVGITIPTTSGSADSEDIDDRMIPELVKKVGTPIVLHTLTFVYNPLSRQSTAAMQALIEDFYTYVQDGHHQQQSLEQQVASTLVNRISHFAQDFYAPVLRSDQQFNNSLLNHTLKQATRGVKLLDNITSWLALVPPAKQELLYIINKFAQNKLLPSISSLPNSIAVKNELKESVWKKMQIK